MKIFLYIFIFISFTYSNAESIVDKFPSVKWFESDEYDLLCFQTYQIAKKNLHRLDLNTSFSTMLEQKNVEGLPSAIIVDIDETILLNLEFQKEKIKKERKFLDNTWRKHIQNKTAVYVNGSRDYLNYVSKNAIKIIYISNRQEWSENKTFELLKELGYPIESKEDLLLKYEKKEWTSNKTSRRIYIANKYRIIQMFGDSLLDFAETNEQAIAHKYKFGKSWFLLPNPMYGTWLEKNQQTISNKKYKGQIPFLYYKP